MDGITTPQKENNVKHVYHQYVVKIDGYLIDRDKFMKYLTKNGIGCAVHYPIPIYKQPLYQELGYTDENVCCPIAEELVNDVLSLPVHPSLSGEDLEYIVDTINNYEEIK